MTSNPESEGEKGSEMEDSTRSDKQPEHFIRAIMAESQQEMDKLRELLDFLEVLSGEGPRIYSVSVSTNT